MCVCVFLYIGFYPVSWVLLELDEYPIFDQALQHALNHTEIGDGGNFPLVYETQVVTKV